MRRVVSLLAPILALLWLQPPGIVQAQTCPCTVWSATTVPNQIDGLDPSPGEYGFRFQATSNGYIKGIRFYKSAANTGVHTGNLWSNTGTLLGTVTFTNESASGWQQANFASPVAVTAGTTYVASYFTPSGHYSYSPSYFTAPVANGPLTALADGTDGGNGAYGYSNVSAFPTSTANSSNYWVDVVYDFTDIPSVTAFSPANGASGVSITPSITVAFNEAMNATSINNSSIQLLDPNNSPITSTVTYNAGSYTATLQPSAQLLNSTVYTVVVHGAAAAPAVTNLAGNPMATNYTWSFSTATAISSAQCPCTIWPSGTVPSTADSGDATAGEYGVRFQASQSGYILGLRYYKAQANGGMHIGNLWSNTGTLLATAAFSGETASGWQQVNFSTPVQVTSGTTYVASYFTSSGHYSYANGGLSASVANPPLTALADGVDGANGVYSYSTTSVFPTSSYQSSNYWVDVVFSPTNVPVVVGYSPLSGTSSAPPGTLVSATFNEAVDPTTVNSNTFQLTDSTGSTVSASVSYNSTTNTAWLAPNSPLAMSSTYTAIVRGGLNGAVIQNPQGTAMPASFSWSFTTGSSTTSGTCPCTIWSPTSSPNQADSGDTSGVNLGVKFTSDISGYVTGIRFYKSALNTGTHIGSLWTSSGTLLASATFTSESASGWQQISFGTPVPITSGTTYVASYFAPSGHYAFDQNTFAGVSVDSPPLHALSSPASGGNGVNIYSTGNAFPTNTYNATNYWVDVVFINSNSTAPPTVVSSTPAAGAVQVSPGTSIEAGFSEAMDATTITSANFLLQDASGNTIPGALTYSTTGATLTFQPANGLLPLATYTATVKGQVKDFLGNQLGADYSWSFTTQGVPSDFGPGGPILVISSSTNPFTRYLGEILLAEGMNEFTVKDISQVDSPTLSQYDIAILGDMSLTSTQAAMLSSWVTSGGNLIAMHPDHQLASLLGITSVGTTLTNAYIQINSATAPGAGIVNQTMQFHGTADLYTLNGATAIANLYSAVATSTSNPAVAWKTVGTGKAAVFTYDLARSVVLTRQGNPAWAGELRDPYVDPAVNVSPIRPDDLFFGNASYDPEPDWIDFSRILIPQADEQQRLLVNMIESMTVSKKPLPRFWYLPGTFKAAIVMTGDDHNHGGTSGRWDDYIAYSPDNCVLANWECVRGTSYVFNDTPIPNYMSYVNQGFELASHHDSIPTCSNWTPASYDQAFSSQLAIFEQAFPGVPLSTTNRNHCVLWSDYDTVPQVEFKYGVRLDTTYYYWPDLWVNDRPGFFTGSGLPMRFTDISGNTLDVYQATTQFPDETTWTYPNDIDTVLDNAVGANGYYAVITANMHTDEVASVGSDAIIQESQARGVPIVTANQMLTWLDGRNSSAFNTFTWDGSNLGFTIAPNSAATNLQAMVPMSSASTTLTHITLNGSPITFAQQLIKGVSYATFPAAAGAYVATYGGNGYYTISGQITGDVSANVKLNLTGPTSTTMAADSSGNFKFAGLPNGTYTITPNWAGDVFTPASQAVTINNGNATNVNFTTAATSVQSVTLSPVEVTGGVGTVTGTVTLTGPAPLGGLSIILTSSDTNSATTPDSASIHAYATSATFTVSTFAVSQQTDVYISAIESSNNSIGTGTLTLDPPNVVSVTVSPSTVVGGNTAIGTVTISGVAGPAGLSVSLASSNTSVATVPSSVVIPSGASSGTFTITSRGVTSSTSVNISATTANTLSAALTVNPPSLTSVSLSSSTVTGGNSVTGTVTLNGAAPSGGAVVSLSDNSPSSTVPASVTIASGSTTATFTVSTSAVSSTVVSTITATYKGVTQTTSLTINPAVMQSVTLSPATVIGGTANSTATVTLTGKVPSATTITLSSSNTSAATVPSTVTISANASSATFTVTSRLVSAATTSSISATYNGTASATLTVNPLAIQSVSHSPTSVVGGNANATTTVKLNAPAPSGGVVVTLSSDNTAAATVPASVTVAASSSTATFTATSKIVSTTNTANIGASYNSSTASAPLTVLPLQISSVTVNPTTVVGGAGSTGTVTLNSTARTGGAVVTLSSNNSAVKVPSSVTVNSGASTATFAITTTSVSVAQVASITATYTSSASTNLTVNPVQASSVTLNPTSVIGGVNSTGTVTLNGAAPSGGLIVSLSSSQTGVAQVPTSVTVPGGSTSTTFTITTSPVSSSTTANIVAGGGLASATLTVTPPTLSSLTLNPTSVKGGTTNSTGTVTLSGRAPSGGATVTLSSNNTSVATVPASVTVAAGSTTATFTVTTKTVTLFSRSVTITGNYGGQKTATLTVTP
jgi:hypothetical protein